MKIISDGSGPDSVRIWTDNGIDITNDLKPLLIDFVVEPGKDTVVIIHCPIKGFIMDGGFGEHTIVESPEESK